MLRSASALHKRIYGTDELNDDVKKYINKTEILIKQQLNDFIRKFNIIVILLGIVCTLIIGLYLQVQIMKAKIVLIMKIIKEIRMILRLI